MTIRVGKVSGVTAPVSGLAGFDQLCAGFLGLCQQLVDLLWAFHVVGHRHATKALTGWRNAGIIGQVIMTEQAEPSAVQFKERHRPIVGHWTAWQAEALLIKADRRRKVLDAKGDHADAWFHEILLFVDHAALYAQYGIPKGVRMELDRFGWPLGPTLNVQSLPTDFPEPPQQDLDAILDSLHEYQRRLFANRRHAVLLVVQGLDAAGKDSLIRTLAQAMDPAAFRVHAFGRPLGEEVDHDFLWRVWRHLPARGDVVAFNRSHYESVLAERLWPVTEHSSDDWPLKYEAINAFEQHLHREGTRIIKIWLNTSQEEQRRRLLKRLAKPRKRWKFDAADVESWLARGAYLTLVNETLAATHTLHAPWHLIPNDNKPHARLEVARLLLTTLKELAPEYPQENPQCIEHYRQVLTKKND